MRKQRQTTLQTRRPWTPKEPLHRHLGWLLMNSASLMNKSTTSITTWIRRAWVLATTGCMMRICSGSSCSNQLAHPNKWIDPSRQGVSWQEHWMATSTRSLSNSLVLKRRSSLRLWTTLSIYWSQPKRAVVDRSQAMRSARWGKIWLRWWRRI